MLRKVAHLTLLTAVAAAPPGTDAPPEGDLDIAAAQQGLDRLVLAMSDVAPAEVVACPLIDSSDVDASFQAAGVDAHSTSGCWRSAADGITCAGSHVGFEDDPSFPSSRSSCLSSMARRRRRRTDTSEALTVTDLPGGTIGTCESDRFVTICEERWQQDGFQVRLLVTDRVYFDRVTASTVLGDLVPVIVANLAAERDRRCRPARRRSAPQAGRRPPVSITLSAPMPALSSRTTTAGLPGHCRRRVRGRRSMAAGVDVDLGDDWTASLTPVTFPDDLDPIPVRLTCTGGFDPQARIDVIDFGDPAAADDFVASVGSPRAARRPTFSPATSRSAPASPTSGLRFCTEWWRGDGLVVGVWLVGDTQSIGNDDAATVLVEVLPTVLANLAAADV